MWRKLLLLGLLALAALNPPAFLLAQNPARGIKFEHLGLEQGLSHNAILCVFQDRQGFMWFGTENGLNKYDGYEFTVYKPDAADSNSLPSRFVQALYVDRAGNLWVGAGDDGLRRYNPDTDKFDRFKHDQHNPESLAGKFVTTILEESRGDLWIGTLTGLYRYNRQRDALTIFRHDPHDTTTISSDGILALCEDRTGTLWIGTDAGINRYKWEKNAFIHYRYNPNSPAGLNSDFIRCIREDQGGVIWIGTSTGLNRYDRQTNKITRCHYDPQDPYTIAPDMIFDMYEDSKGTFWIGTFHLGLWRYEAATDRFFSYRHNPDDPHSLSEDRIHCIYEDRSGVMWLGTYRHGLNRYDRRQDAFTRYQTAEDVYAVRQDRNSELWIGARNDGLLRYDRQGKRVAQYRHDPKNPMDLNSDVILAIHEDSQGELWIGTVRGLNRYDAKRNSFVRYNHEPLDPGIPEHHEVKTIYEDADGELWIGTNGSGLCRLDREKKTFTYFRYDPQNHQSLGSNNVWAICEDKNGTLWVGTFGGGVNHMNRKTQAFKRYQYDPNNPYSLNNDAIYSLYADTGGDIWIGTWGGGVNRLDLRTERFTHYTEREGLPDEFVKGILPDNHGNLWLSTDKGLSRFNLQKKTFKNFTVKDGLISNQFLSGAYCKGVEGRLFFGGEGGVISFYPDSLKDNPYVPPVVITSFKVFDKPLPLPKAVFSLDAIQLSYRQNFFSFEFAALHYAEPTKNQYAYKLEGFDLDWAYSGTQRFANYTNVDPGEYVFRMKGANSDGVWNEEGASLKITITPPWWKTWWAYTLSVIAIGAVLYVIGRFELGRARLKHKLELELIHAEKLKEIDRMKSRFFANISHEFRTPLTLILGPLENLLSENFPESAKKQFRVMLRNGRRLLRLINQLLDLAKLEAGSMSLKTRPENLIPLLKGIVLSFSSLAERKWINLKFEATEKNITAYIDRDKFEKIMTNLLSNAFKFTLQGGEICVSVFHYQGKHPDVKEGRRGVVEITVTDSGIGIPQEKVARIFDRFYQVDDSYTREQEGSGIGLALTKELVELHHGEIRVASEYGKGSTFTVCLPLGNDHLNADEIIDDVPLPEKDLSEVSRVSSEEIPEEWAVGKLSKISKPWEGSHAMPIVLIVEDNADVRRYIRDYLEKEYQIMEAVDGEEGLEKSTTTLPDLIISDVMMPKMDGYELCSKLKTDERTDHIPIILLTARAGEGSKIEGLETGADDYIIKPFDARELQVRVKNLIEQRHKLRERFRQEINLQPKDIAITSMDEQFLQKVMAAMEQNLSDPDFSTDEFAKKVALSRSQLNRKLRTLTGYPTHEFIRIYRLKRAAQLLQNQAGTVTEICYDVGFNSPFPFRQIISGTIRPISFGVCCRPSRLILIKRRTWHSSASF